MSDLSTVNTQRQWLMQSDETHLTHIKLRLGEIIERFLMMPSSQPFSHIDRNDRKNFLDRYGYLCRFIDCYQYLGKVLERYLTALDRKRTSAVSDDLAPFSEFAHIGHDPA